MFLNHIKVDWRNLIKTKGYAAINIGGLSVGLAITLLIGMWLWDELSFNKFHKKYNEVAQIMNVGNFNGQRFASDNIQIPLEKVLRTNYGNQFKQIVLSRYPQDEVLTVGDTKVKQSGRIMQEGAPELLSLEMMKGTRSGLHDPSSILLSASAAKALFGDRDPMDQTVKISNKVFVKV